MKDLKLKEGQIYIGGSRKSNERTIELKSKQIIELMEYQYQVRAEIIKERKEETIDKLFLSSGSVGSKKASDKLHIWKGFTKELKKQDSRFINFQQLRGSVISHWLKQYNLREVQYRAGHRYVSSTESYLVNNTEDLQADIDQYHPF